MTTAVLYHSNCPDGWTAAWIAHRALTEQQGAEPVLHAVQHGDPPPDLTGVDDVYLVDFAYPHEVLVDMAVGFRSAGGRRVVVLDHHRTAIDDIEAHDEPLKALPYKTDLDVDRSGAGITWDWFHPGEPRPLLVDYVEDRDLWRWQLRRSKAVNAYIRSQPYTLDAWDETNLLDVDDMADAGEGVLLHIEAYCRAAANHAYWCEMGGRRFPIVNVTYEACSEVAAHLLDVFDADMAGYFFERGTGGWQYGFRSRNGVTVHDFAAQFGGGGHPQASGCVTETPVHRRVES